MALFWQYPNLKRTLPNGKSYTILDRTPRGNLDNTQQFYIPEGHYFFLGDNRDQSADSRTQLVGMVPRSNLVGEANVVFFSVFESIWQIWRGPSAFRDNRFWIPIE